MALPHRSPDPQPESARSAVPARELREIAGRSQPPVAAQDRVLPVGAELEPLLPWGGLQRGTVATVRGSTSLALALISTASQAGAWCAAVGLPSLGLVAAAEAGIALERFPLVPWPSLSPSPGGDGRPGGWAWVVAALLDSVDIVLAGSPPYVRATDARRLTARARERGSVLVVTDAGGKWPAGAAVHLEMVKSHWVGIGSGHGRLRECRIEVAATSRRTGDGRRLVATVRVTSSEGGADGG